MESGLPLAAAGESPFFARGARSVSANAIINMTVICNAKTGGVVVCRN